ncbi:hypothetical protein DV735_g5932, partial [Chaetothyriales sp. CBS 134920]
MSLLDIDRKPLKRLTAVFAAWKVAIALVALAAPGPGYDSSSTFLHLSPGFLAKFVRWDAVYFTQIAQRGHVFEQEWAFGVGLTTTLRWLSQRLFLTRRPDLYQITVTGILLSHGMHYLSTILTYYIASLVLGFPTKAHPYRRGAVSVSSAQSRVPAVAALLYIFSPAGIILSVPYTEALFAFRNLLGLLVYIYTLRSQTAASSTTKALLTIISGVILSTATAVRSNGILSGIPFLLTFLAQLYQATTSVLRNRRLPQSSTILTLTSLFTAGILIAAGQILPQIPAYQKFCITPSSSPPRPWCSYTIPSIFTFAQQHYWNVGLFNYWTVSNIPLFLLAAPTISLLTYSSYHGLQQVISRNIFAFHVQIITRIASGYPWWYIWLAEWIVKDESQIPDETNHDTLYASFLPPA